VFNGTRDRYCTVQHMDGATFCDIDAHPDLPFPICAKHALRLFRYMAEALDESEPTIGFTPADAGRAVDYRARVATRKGGRTVYYLLVGDLVKIGRTADLTKRIRDYPPHTVLLGTERGGPELEKLRHVQFAHLRAAGREWFTPGPELRAHIESLADYQAAA
jgi:hypothetical protein